MKKVLFLSINYSIEGIEHGTGALNGSTAISEMLVAALAEWAEVDVVSDRPERFPRHKVLDIFRMNASRAYGFEDFWRKQFRVFGAPSSNEFSRDTLYRLFQLANALDPEALDDLLLSEHYDVVVLNRHEYFFLSRHPGFAGKQIVFCAHDSNYLRKLSYEDGFKTLQPLTHVEKVLEEALVAEANKLISLSSSEADYFKNIVEDCEVVLFRPIVARPARLVSLIEGKGINFYFVGVNNFVNRQTLECAVKLFMDVRRAGVDNFHVFGFVSAALPSGSLDEDVVLHGHVDDLEGALAEMHVLLAPIHSGSGIPIKFSDALSAGHLVVSSAFGATSYAEFIGTRIIISDDLTGSVLNALRTAKATYAPYEKYGSKNRQAAKQIVG